MKMFVSVTKEDFTFFNSSNVNRPVIIYKLCNNILIYSIGRPIEIFKIKKRWLPLIKEF